MNRSATLLVLALAVVSAACRKSTKASDDAGTRQTSPAAPGSLAGARAPKRLYAQRLAEIRVESPRGRVIGRLHPGAPVSIAPHDAPAPDAGWVRIGDPAPNADKKPLVAFVERSALGGFVAPAPRDARPGSEVRATFGYLANVWYERGGGGPLRFRRCHEVWLRDRGDVAFQVLEGVELFGYNESAFAWSASPVAHHSLVCPAHAVTERDGKLALIAPNPRWEPGDAPGTDVVTQTIGGVPASFTRVAAPDPDELSSAIERGESLYWLIATEKGPVCDRWRFERMQKKSDSGRTAYEGRLVHPGRLARFDESGLYYPAEYRPAFGGMPAELRLDTLRMRGNTAMKCVCDYRYRVLARHGSALLALARPIPDGTIAFDATEAERWFFDEKACEAHRDDAVRAIERDGGMTTRVGLHATELL